MSRRKGACPWYEAWERPRFNAPHVSRDDAGRTDLTAIVTVNGCEVELPLVVKEHPFAPTARFVCPSCGRLARVLWLAYCGKLECRQCGKLIQWGEGYRMQRELAKAHTAHKRMLAVARVVEALTGAQLDTGPGTRPNVSEENFALFDPPHIDSSFPPDKYFR